MTAPFDPQPTSTALRRRAGGSGGGLHVPGGGAVEGELGRKLRFGLGGPASVSLTRWTRDGESWHRQHQHAQARFTSDVNAHGAGTRATRPLWRRHPGTAGLTSAPARPSSAVMEAKVHEHKSAQTPADAVVGSTSCVGCLSCLFPQKLISLQYEEIRIL